MSVTIGQSAQANRVTQVISPNAQTFEILRRHAGLQTYRNVHVSGILHPRHLPWAQTCLETAALCAYVQSNLD
jgi:hypothetical protein